MMPVYCPLCLKAGVIATVGGPTCAHSERTGVKWFPDWWSESAFENPNRRVEYLQKINQAPAAPQS
jgi:hypothetical protein